MSKKEQARYLTYQDIYQSKQPEPAAPVDAGAASATKTMGTRRSKYPEGKGLSREGRDAIRQGRR